MYVDRLLHHSLKLALKQFPAVIICGPRQSGKTTLLKQELKDDYHYITFDDPLNRSFADSDPLGFLDQFQLKKGVILDEIQYVPGLFPYIKMKIDDSPQHKGRFIMTGSQQFNLMKNISESLAGRICILELLPFSFRELAKKSDQSIKNMLWTGQYPAIVVGSTDRDLWLRSYIGTYLERDIRQLQHIKNMSSFERFLALCAGRHGQILNMASLSNDAGISQPTCKEWLSALQASYIIHLVQPYHANINKRFIKSPKLYFLDSGIVSYLTRQSSADAQWASAMGGVFFEGFIVSELIKANVSQGRNPDFFYLRTKEGLEADLVIRAKETIHLLEIKQTATPNLHHAENLIKLQALLKDKNTVEARIVCNIKEKKNISSSILAVSWRDPFEGIL